VNPKSKDVMIEQNKRVGRSLCIIEHFYVKYWL